MLPNYDKVTWGFTANVPPAHDRPIAEDGSKTQITSLDLLDFEVTREKKV